LSNFFDEILGQSSPADRTTVKSVPTVDPVDIISNTTREDINQDIEQAVLGYSPLDALLEEPVRREATGQGDGLTIQTVENSNTVNILELDEIKTRRRALGSLEFSNVVRPQIADPLRYMLGKYWVLRPSGKPKIYHEDMSFSNIKKVPLAAKIKNVKYDYSQEYPEEVSVIQLYPDQNQIKSTDSRYWTFFIEGSSGGAFDTVVEYQEPKTDHYIQDEKPFTQRELDLISGVSNNKFANIEVFYNFYIDQFEETAADVDERITPKVYGFEAIIEDGNEESLGDQMARRLNTLNGTLSDRFFVDGDTDLGQYFDEWAIAASSDDYSYLSEEQGFFSLSVKDMEQFVNERIERRARQFPYYIKLSFSAESRTQLAEILEQSGLTKSLFRYLMNSQYDIQNQGFSAIAPALSFSEYSSATTIRNLDSVIIQNSNAVLDRRVWDISDWLREVGVFQTDLDPEEASLPEFLVSSFDREDATADIITTLPESSNFNLFDLVKGYTYEIQTSDPEDPSVFSKYIAQGKIRKLIRKELRPIEEVFKGQPAYSEIIGFRIAKHLVDEAGQPSPEPIQNIYIPNSNGFNVASYIDTQIRYNGTYKYIVYALNFVIGNQYEYERASQQLKFSFDQNSPYGFVVRNKPSIKVFETEYYSTETVRLIDRPPMPPEFEFQEYKDINNKLIINLSRNMGEMEMPYILINAQEESNLELLRESQPGRDNIFRFASDDDIKAFEVFRITEAPSSYRDFSNSGRLFTTQSPNQDFFSRDYQSLTIIDDIVPNRKYYYTFRNRDVHGFYSNPSEVFEVEMIRNSGTSYLIARPYKFPEDLPSTRKKSFRKFIRITPSMIQMAINTFKTDLRKFASAQEIKNITLGQAREKLWNKSIKMRITSKKTGRKIDINFSYEHLVKTLLFLDKGTSEVTPIENVINTDSFSAALQLLLIEQDTDLI
jgi:hypothetical protein